VRDLLGYDLMFSSGWILAFEPVAELGVRCLDGGFDQVATALELFVAVGPVGGELA